MKQQLTSSTLVETFKDAAPNHENTCKLIYHSMLQLADKMCCSTTPETQRYLLNEVYKTKHAEYEKMNCNCHKEMNDQWFSRKV